ncbi:hypothetical protein B0H11DRAFT_2123568 [Mycena galericulata]|nr:hypothetical protein B0H11DRAFT_2123568 [Mycena galericulata]
MDRITPCASVLQASRSLYLRAMTWKDIDDFGSLTELVLSNIHFGTLDSTFPELKTLEIDYGCQDILEWLRLCSPKFPRLSTIHLKLSEIIPSNQRFSPDFAPCLEHMELGFYRLYLESLRDFKVDLSKSRALRSIHISHLQLNELGLSGVDPLRNRVYVGWVPEVLGSVASPSVEKLHLSIWVTNVSDINLLDWTSLKQVFQRSDPNPFSSLNTLLLDMYGKMYDKVDRDAVEKTIHTALEGCRVFDLLKFRWH